MDGIIYVRPDQRSAAFAVKGFHRSSIHDVSTEGIVPGFTRFRDLNPKWPQQVFDHRPNLQGPRRPPTFRICCLRYTHAHATSIFIAIAQHTISSDVLLANRWRPTSGIRSTNRDE